MTRLLHARAWLERACTLPDDAVDERRRKVTLFLLAAICVLASIVWGTLYYAILGPRLVVPLTFGFTVVVGSALVVFLFLRRFNLLLYPFFLMILWNPIAMQWSLGGFAASGVLMTWSILAPFCALMFQDTRKAMGWFAAYLVLLTISLVLDGQFQAWAVPTSQTTSMLFFAMNLIGPSVAIFVSMMYYVNAFQKAHQRSESLLLNILPAPIAERLKEREETIADAFPEVTILFADIVDFTPLSARISPQDLVQLLNRIFSAFDRLTEQYGLEKIKTIGDAYMEAGGTVVVATRTSDAAERIRDEGFRLCPLDIDRSTLTPPRDLKTLRALVRLYRDVRPEIVHHVAIKPTLYGSIAAAWAGVPAAVNAVTGLGFLFISRGPVAAVVRPLLQRAYRFLFNRSNSRLILQNEDDRRFFVRIVGVDPARTVIIRGSGVDIATFRPTPEPEGTPIALCVSRMLKDKGVGELVEAARILRHREVPVRVRLVGPTDDNPASFPPATLKRWQAEGIVEVAGPTDDVAAAYAKAHIAVLPSYREGLPKSLLEGAACGRPMVATDVPGCREICRDGETGLLVPVREAAPLADALERLARDPGLRQHMGRAARNAVEANFAEEIIVRDTLALYEEMLGEAARQA